MIRRSIILPLDMWDTALYKARSQKSSLSSVIRELLVRWIKGEIVLTSKVAPEE